MQPPRSMTVIAAAASRARCQSLIESGNGNLTDTLRASSRALSLTRAAVRDPAKTAASLTAKALGVPALPVRLAVVALSLVRSVGRSLTR